MRWTGTIVGAFIAASLLTRAAADETGRYRLHLTGLKCVVAPCADTRITDRVTGQVIIGAIELRLSDSKLPENTELFGRDGDPLVDGELHQDGSPHNIPVLWITKIVGRVIVRRVGAVGAR